MLLTCEQKDLLAALTTVSKAVNLNSTLPVLNNISDGRILAQEGWVICQHHKKEE